MAGAATASSSSSLFGDDEEAAVGPSSLFGKDASAQVAKPISQHGVTTALSQPAKSDETKLQQKQRERQKRKEAQQNAKQEQKDAIEAAKKAKKDDSKFKSKQKKVKHKEKTRENARVNKAVRADEYSARRGDCETKTTWRRSTAVVGHYGPMLILLLSILMIRRAPRQTDDETDAEAKTRQLAYAQVVLSIFLVLATSGGILRKVSRAYEVLPKKAGVVVSVGEDHAWDVFRRDKARSVSSQRIAQVLSVLVAAVGGVGAASSPDTVGMVLSIGMILLGVSTALCLHSEHVRCKTIWTSPARAVYKIIDQLENTPGLSSIITVGLLFWIVMQMLNIRFAFPTSEADPNSNMSIYYPDEKKSKSSTYYLVRTAEFVLVLLIFMAGRFAVNNTESGWMHTIFKVPIKLVDGKLTYFWLVLLLGVCSVYMFWHQGYKSFAVDTLLLGVVTIGYHGHIHGEGAGLIPSPSEVLEL